MGHRRPAPHIPKSAHALSLLLVTPHLSPNPTESGSCDGDRGTCSGQHQGNHRAGVWLPPLVLSALYPADRPRGLSLPGAGYRAPSPSSGKRGSGRPHRGRNSRQEPRIAKYCKIFQAGPIRSVKWDMCPELGHIIQLCLGRAGSTGDQSYLSKSDSYGN